MSAGAMVQGVKSLPCVGEELSLGSQRCDNSHLNPNVPLVGEKVQTGECPKSAGLLASKTQRASQRRWNKRTDGHAHTHECEHAQNKHTHMYTQTHMHTKTYTQSVRHTERHMHTQIQTHTQIHKHAWVHT